jgi:hypothetical protein
MVVKLALFNAAGLEHFVARFNANPRAELASPPHQAIGGEAQLAALPVEERFEAPVKSLRRDGEDASSPGLSAAPRHTRLLAGFRRRRNA